MTALGTWTSVDHRAAARDLAERRAVLAAEHVHADAARRAVLAAEMDRTWLRQMEHCRSAVALEREERAAREDIPKDRGDLHQLTADVVECAQLRATYDLPVPECLRPGVGPGNPSIGAVLAACRETYLAATEARRLANQVRRQEVNP